MRKRIKRWQWIVGGIIALFVGGFILPFASWLVADEFIAATSEHEFCVSCHSMQPMKAAYLQDIHGGNSTHGVQVHCTDCHLDHSSSAAYFADKARTGLHDMYVEYLVGTDDIDWVGNLANRAHYVYDSGCLECHRNLENATMGNNKAFVAHRPYFLGETSKQCVECHEHVGHKDLVAHLTRAE